MIASHVLAAVGGAVLALIGVWINGVWRDWKLLRRHYEHIRARADVIDLTRAREELRSRGPR